VTLKGGTREVKLFPADLRITLIPFDLELPYLATNMWGRDVFLGVSKPGPCSVQIILTENRPSVQYRYCI